MSPELWQWRSQCPGGRAKVMRGQQDTGKSYRKGKSRGKIPNIWGEKPVEKGVGSEGQRVEVRRFIGASQLLGNAAQGHRAQPGSTALQDILTSLLLV